MKKALIGLCLLLLLAGWSAFPGGSAFWQMDSFAEFSRGTFAGISLSRDGTLSLAPRMQQVFASNQALVWTMAEDSSGNVYLGTGHSGKVYRIDAQSKSEQFFDAPEPEVFALAVDRQNNLYAGTSPDGKVYKVTPDGKSQTFFDPQAKYIWSLALAPDGTLLVGTGDRGRIYQVSPGGSGKLFYDTLQAHVMSLAFAPDRTLVAGTAPNGLLFRISPAGRGSVLYDAPLAEIHSVSVAADGSVLASAIAAGAPRPMVPSAGGPIIIGDAGAPATITVQAATGDKPDVKGSEKEKPKGEADKAVRDAAAVPNVDFTTGTKSAIYRVAPDRTVETLWSSRDETVFDVLPSTEGTALFSTDERGRIYQLNAEKQTTLLVQTNEEQTTRLLRRGASVLAATANFGKLFRLDTAPGDEGTYESPVKDTQSISRWGRLSWRGTLAQGSKVQFFTRTGNSATPDPTWSDWEPTRNSAAVAGRNDRFEDEVASPPARYVQWKAAFRASGGHSAGLEEVTVAYLPQNRAPVIQSVSVSGPMPAVPRVAAAGATTASTAATADQPIVVVVDDSSPKSSAPSVLGGAAAPAGQPRAGMQPTVTITWQADDPDGDRLSYALYIRGEGETAWRLLKEGIHETTYQPEPETLPDGKYQVRVVASDAEANPQQTARTAEQISAPFLVDNTPPAVQTLEPERKGEGARVRFRVNDAASVLRRAEYSVDGGPWYPIYSEDGIVDSQAETFVISLDRLAAGEHIVVLRAYDSGGNPGMGKAILK